MIKKQNKKILILTLSIILSCVFISSFAAQKLNYQMLEPGAFKDVNPSTLSGFISGLFNLLIAVAVVLAVLMIIIGVFQYMTTDSWQKKSDGLQKVKDAFIGLGMALLAYLILWTINPCLVEFSGGKGCSETNKIIQLK